MNHRTTTIMETVKTAAWKLSVFVSCFLFAHPVAAQVRTTFSGLALSSRSPVDIALNLISWFLGILAVLALILVLYGGFLWMFSQGDEEKIQKAKDVLRNALIGLFIILSAWGIVLYILGVLLDATGTGSEGGTDPGDCLGCSVPGGSSDFYVLATNPEAGETGVYLCTDVTVRFSENVDQSSFTADNWHVQVYNGAPADAACSQNNDCASSLCSIDTSTCVGDYLDGTIGFGPGDSTSYVNFVPSADLESDTVYEGVVVGGAGGVASEDTSDDGIDDRLSLTTSYTFTFTTGNETDTIPPTVQETSSSPFPEDGGTDICLNTVINFDFSEAMRITTFNDDTSYLLDSAGTTSAPVAPDWTDPVSLTGWSFGGNFDYASVRPATQLEANSLYSTRLYGGDANNNFFGGLTDSCGNALDGNDNGVSDGSTVDNYFGYDADGGESEDPITFETGENSECTPIIDSIDPGYDYYGEYLGKHDGESCSASSECASGSCVAGFCDGYGATSLTITGLYLAPHPEVLMEGSVVYASEDLNTCFNADHLGNVETDTSQGDQCLDDALQSTSELVLRTPVGVKDTAIQVAVAGETSEPSSDVLDELSPYIASIDPSSGSAGQYITVSGANFGDDQGSGTVVMRSADGIRQSTVSLPEACGDTWQDDQIVIIAPETYINSDDGSTGTWTAGDVAYVQITNDNGRHSDLQQFVYSDVIRPNLCEIVNSCDAAGGASFYVVGDHFGDSQGGSQVAFALGDGTGYDASISSWSDTRAEGTTSESMGQDGYWVSVYDAATGLNSNGLSYDIPCNSGPQVANITSCNEAESIYPAPNPEPNSTEACINASVGVLFDQEMDRTTFSSSSVYLDQYNAGDTFDSAFTPIRVSGHFQTTSWSYTYNEDVYYGFQYNIDQTQVDEDQDGVSDGESTATLQPNTWYQLTITADVRNTDGVAMAAPYTMRFKTDDTEELCDVASIDLEPQSSTQNTFWDTDLGDISREDYTGTPYAAECKLLDADTYSWDWTVADEDIGNFGGGPEHSSSEQVFVAGNTADNEGTTQVTTSVDSISDSADFTVDLGFCESDADCAMCGGSSCDEETHHCTPVINSIDPTDGDNGTWVTINGCMLGSAKGNVYWNTTDDTVSAETDWPDETQCGSTWSDTQIIAEVPDDYDSDGDDVRDTALPETTYNVEVQTQYDATDESDDIFTLNSTVHPGLCVIDPDQGEVGDGVTAQGQGLGSTEGYASFYGTDDYDLDGNPDRVSAHEATVTWADSSITADVPTGAATGMSVDGKDGFKAITAGGDEQCADSSFCSNALDFIVSCDADVECATGICSESGICVEPPVGEECTTDADCQVGACGESTCSDTGYCTPVINSLYYSSGPNGSATTIEGCYFRSYGAGSAVYFGTVEGGFPCADSWTDTEIVTEVPDASELGATATVELTVQTDLGDSSNSEEFTVTDECSNGAPVPSEGVPLLCDLIPGTGHAASSDGSTPGDTIEFSGDHQASISQNNVFSDEVDGDNWVFNDRTSSTAEVPYGAVTGDAYVNATACVSNGLAFTVECSEASECGDGSYCVDGLCTDPEVEGASCGGVAACTTATSDAICGSDNGCYYDSGEASYCCTERPTIVSNTLISGSVDVCPNVQFRIQFSQGMYGLKNIKIEEVATASETATVISTIPYTATTNAATFTSTITPTSLSTSTLYRLRIPSATDGAASAVRSNTTGLHLLEGSQYYYFTTASSTCIPDHMELLNDETGQTSHTFTAANSSTTFTTYMYSDDDQLLAASDDVDWEYTWSPYYDAEACDNVAWVDITEDEDETETGGATSETQTVTSGEENDGVTTLTATATATAGWSGSLAENSTLSTFYCNEDEVWQYVDQVGGESYVSHSYPQNFRLIYCDTDDLPTLNAPVVTEGSGADDWFLQYLFYNASDEDQAFSIRVYENADNLTPEEWYNQNVPNPSSPSELTVDGYQAVRDGLSYYVAASNIGDDTDGDGLDELYSNIYLITFNDEDTLLQIADQLMDYIRFNWNVSYAECDGSDKDKLTRDTKRVADLGTVISLANDYYDTNEEYPEPQSDTFGSYITNITDSVWSSWQGGLGNVLGQTLPEDPYNFFYASDTNDPWNASETPWLNDDSSVAQCEYDADNNAFYDTAGTCWDSVNNTFFCPENSHTYLWKVDTANSDNAYVYANMEYDSSSTETFINQSSVVDACDDTDNSECSCFNYALSSSTDPGGEWQ